ncbi:MAG TPA: hypothetical protein VMD74_01230 [Candidatus Methylomirabilis sp.]|nr:hypothetical protein [Candidatus Methylomirabilis sp.]
MTQKNAGVYSPVISKKSTGLPKIKIINFFLLVLIVAGGLYYVTGINDLVVKGFKLQELKNKSGNLAEENRQLNIETASLQSYNNVAKRVGNLGMVAVDNVDYLKVNGGVALVK